MTLVLRVLLRGALGNPLGVRDRFAFVLFDFRGGFGFGVTLVLDLHGRLRFTRPLVSLTLQKGQVKIKTSGIQASGCPLGRNSG